MLEFKTKKYPCSVLHADSTLPDLSYNKKAVKFKSTIQDFEGLFIGYGSRETSYPYRQQNQYEDSGEQEVNVAVLENEYMYAEFLVDFGGRLWRLYDKQKKQDVVYANDIIRLSNLSMCNAWFSGGVEWNCAVIGHTPFTCRRMYCAEVKGENGEEILRFYEFERTRSIYYQIDFWLNKNCLFSRVHIVNQNDTVVPMYWWSNIATPEFHGGRVAVPAQSAYNNSDGLGIKKSDIPVDNGVDVSYSENIVDTIDYFYDIPSDKNKFIANINSDGGGLLQMSSNRLKGRKLFSWGHRSGSSNWQERLTKDAGWYVEIQAGLGKTQYECIPMPPKVNWDFLECYTLADIDKKVVNAEYSEFVEAVNQQVESIYSSKVLDEICDETLSTIALKKGKTIYKASGYGYLYEKLGGKCPQHLEFSKSEDISMWLELMGEKDNENSVDFAFGELQKELLLSMKDKTDWRVPYQLGLLAFDGRDYERAKSYAQQAFLYENNIYTNHLYACVLFCTDDKRYTYFVRKTLLAGYDNYSVCERMLKLLIDGEEYQAAVESYSLCSEEIQKNDRIKMYLSYAYLKLGDVQKANELLWSNGGLSISDYREGEKFLDALYRGIEHEINGTPLDEIVVPKQFDFIVAKQVHENE